jgi:nitrogen fixation NifU-like protein
VLDVLPGIVERLRELSPYYKKVIENLMAYSEKLLDYFQNPRCVGAIPMLMRGSVSNPVCGDVMKLWVKVRKGRIQDAKFKAQGCSAAIATSSYATEMVIGMTVAEARQITKEQIRRGALADCRLRKFIAASLRRTLSKKF